MNACWFFLFLEHLGGAGAAAETDEGRVAAWAANLWPTGLDRLQREINHTRERQQVNVNNRLLVEALLARVATELGSARRVGRSG